MYLAIGAASKVLVRARIANRHAIASVPTSWVLNEKVVVFPRGSFTTLQSTIHEEWAREYSSTLKTDLQYTPSDCCETFPFPHVAPSEVNGAALLSQRDSYALERRIGLTRIYNEFHDRTVTNPVIQRLRELQVAMDRDVASSYGWPSTAINHAFETTKAGERFALTATSRAVVLERLLEENHRRYDEEDKQRLQGTERARRAVDDEVGEDHDFDLT
jgi:hypothetical protein